MGKLLQLNPLKKDGSSVRKIGKTEVAFLFAVLSFMSIFLSWIKQQDLAVVILYKKFAIVSPACAKAKNVFSFFNISFPGCVPRK